MANSLSEAFHIFVTNDPGAQALVTTGENGADIGITRRQLHAAVQDRAAALASSGVAGGDRVVLALGNSQEFVILFWALQLLGAAAVPVPSLDRGAARMERQNRLRSVCMAADPALVIVGDDAFDVAPSFVVAPLSSPSRLLAGGREHVAMSSDGEATGVIQFTSGSTGKPRGCVLSQRALLANALAVNGRCSAAPHDTAVSWLPVFHDMGLMTGVIAPVIAGARSCLRQTARFMFNPLSWLHDLGAFPGTHTAVPSFALAMTLLRLSRRPSLENIDLSGVKSIVCGAEPIDAALVGDFLDRLAPAGLRADSFHAAYGMAEATLMITSKPGGLAVASFDRAALQSGGLATPVADDEGMVMVSLGSPVPGVTIEIADAAKRRLPNGRLGFVKVRSPAMMSGYFADPQATQDVLDGEWLTTNDIGFIVAGDLFLSCRASDLILVAGRNIAPFDIEAAVGRALGVSANSIAAFGAAGSLGTEGIHVVVECRDVPDRAALAASVRAGCIAGCGVTARGIHPVRPGFLPRTTSGKVQRGELRKRWIANPGLFAHPESTPTRSTTTKDGSYARSRNVEDHHGHADGRS